MKLFSFAIILISFSAFSQNDIDTELDSINTIQDYQEYMDSAKNVDGKLVTFNKEKHKTTLANDLFKMSKGGKKVVESNYKTVYYKIIDKSGVVHNRVSCIFFDGSKMTLENINAQRALIITKYKEGFNFKTLAKYYSMDLNAQKGGDLGWFPNGVMHPEFEQSIKAHNVDDIFTLDIPEKGWYYVILKTHKPQAIEELTVLKFSKSKT
jgi:hypothetical protein